MVCLRVILSLLLPVASRGFLVDGGDSCIRRCDSPLDRSHSCQCNYACERHNDCCPDYKPLCISGAVCSSSAYEVSRLIWSHDVNRFAKTAYQLNLQGHVPDYSTLDRAQEKLFRSLDESQLTKPTYAAYLKLLDNFDPNKGISEKASYAELQEVNNFLDEILKTDVMTILSDYVKCLNLTNNQREFHDLLYKLWFQGYPRSSYGRRLDTSGFEHVMVGEFKNQTTVNGFHGWLTFYVREKAGDINYRGYVRKHLPDLVGASFTWKGRQKSMGTFMVGTSPEFDLAIFTLCYLTHPNSACQTDLGGQRITVKSYDSNGHVGTAYMDF